MVDAENMVALHPKPLSIPEFVAIKKEIGEEYQKAQQQKRLKPKMITVISDSDQSASDKSTAPFPPSPRPFSAKKSFKTSIKINKTIALSDLLTSPTQTDKDIIPFHLVFTVAAPTPVPKSIVFPAPPSNQITEVSSNSSVLIAPRPRGEVVIREPLPESTRFGFKVLVSTEKEKGRCLQSPNTLNMLAPSLRSKQQLIF